MGGGYLRGFFGSFIALTTAALTTADVVRSQNNNTVKETTHFIGNQRDGIPRAATSHQAKFGPPSTDCRKQIDNFMAAVPRCRTEPVVFAHRGGGTDFPENTLLAIEGALKYSGGIWLTVQLSSDGVPVLYQPRDLSALTDQNGPVRKQTVATLAQANAGWNFTRLDSQQDVTHPYRTQPVGIPTLKQALDKIPCGIPVILDMKDLPAPDLAKAVVEVLQREDARSRSRIIIYSTDAKFQEEFEAHYANQALLFESRDKTRGRFVKFRLTGKCDPPPDGTWIGYELYRDLTVSEEYTLGVGKTKLEKVPILTPDFMRCLRKGKDVTVLAFGVDTENDYSKAKDLKVNGVLANSPKKMHEIQSRIGLAKK